MPLIIPERKYDLSLRGAEYNKLLAKVFLATVVSNKALFSSDMTEANIYAHIRKAVANGHLKEREYKEILHGKTKMRKYYTITADGIKYLSCQSTCEWIQYLPVDVDYVTVFTNDRKAKRISFLIKCGNALLLALNAGANITDYFFSGEVSPVTQHGRGSRKPQRPDDCLFAPDAIQAVDLDEDFSEQEDETAPEDDAGENQCPGKGRVSKYIGDIRKETYALMKTKTGRVPVLNEGNSKITFFPIAEIKARIRDGTEAVDKTDFRYGKYTGLFVTPVSSILLYHADQNSIKWNNSNVNYDIKTICQFSRICSPYDNIYCGNLHGAVIVPNSKVFADIILSRNSGSTVDISKMFDTMRLIPLSPNGAKLLNWCATNTTKAKRAYVDNLITAQCNAVKNGDGKKTAFRLKDGGTYLLDGYEMDYKGIRAALTILDKIPDLNFKIIAFRWQEEYYRKLWRNADFVFLD